MDIDRDELVRAPEGTRSSVRHFSLMNSLLTIINQNPHDSMNSTLARYFLEHFDHLDALNVYDVAEDCYTSRSGIRRFCQAIGLDNFSDLKSYAWEWSRHRRLFSRYADHENYREYLIQALAEMDQMINRAVPDGTLDELSRIIYGSNRVVILTSDFSSGAVRQFQQSMLYLHKIIDIVTDSTGDVAQLDSLGGDDALVVISEHGNYARAVQTASISPSVRRILVTVDADEETREGFTRVIGLSSEPATTGRTVYAQYGITYLLDLLYNRYYVLYGKRDASERRTLD